MFWAVRAKVHLSFLLDHSGVASLCVRVRVCSSYAVTLRWLSRYKAEARWEETVELDAPNATQAAAANSTV